MANSGEPNINDLCGKGKYLEAVAVGEQQVGKRPTGLILRLQIARLYGSLEEFSEAERHLEVAEDFTDGSEARVYVERARLQQFKGSHLAQQSALRSIELDPEQRQWIYHLARHPLLGAYLVMDSHKLIYSPVPKSGSTTMKALFGGDSGGHLAIQRRFDEARLRSDRLRLGQLHLDQFYKFAILRDDIDRFLSYCSKNVAEGSLFRAANSQETYFDLPTYPCLLYTSPSPRDRTRSRMPSSA